MKPVTIRNVSSSNSTTISNRDNVISKLENFELFLNNIEDFETRMIINWVRNFFFVSAQMTKYVHPISNH